MLCSQSIGVPCHGGSHCPHVPFTRWACRDKFRAGGICRPESRLGACRRPGEGPFGTRLLLVASGLGAGSCPALASRLPPGPGLSFADRLARKLSACLVPSAAGSVVLGRAPVVGACGAATRGRSRPSGPALLALEFRGCRVGGSLLKGSASTRRSACILPIPPPPPVLPPPPNSELRH